MNTGAKSLKRALCMLLAAAFVMVSSSGCAVMRYLMTGDWNGNADVVVVSQSPDVIGSIALHQEDGSRVLADARGLALVERGESYGLMLDDGEEDCTIVLLDMDGQEAGRTEIHFRGTRLYLTLQEDGSVTVSEEKA